MAGEEKSVSCYNFTSYLGLQSHTHKFTLSDMHQQLLNIFYPLPQGTHSVLETITLKGRWQSSAG